MICRPCRNKAHHACANGGAVVGTWCDCQHKEEMSEKELRDLADAHRDEVVKGSGVAIEPRDFRTEVNHGNEVVRRQDIPADPVGVHVAELPPAGDALRAAADPQEVDESRENRT